MNRQKSGEDLGERGHVSGYAPLLPVRGAAALRTRRLVTAAEFIPIQSGRRDVAG
jgi:hypothetical protein